MTSVWTRAAAFSIPYVAVLVGLYALRSAWAAFLLYHAGVVVALTVSRTWPKAVAGFRVSPFSSPRGGLWTFAGIAMGVIGGVLMHLLWSWFAGPADALRAAIEEVGLAGSSWLAFAAYHALVNPWVEEAFWRGALNQPGRLVRADVAFAAYHVLVLWRFTEPGPMGLAFLALVIAAAVWRYTVRETGSLWPAALSHVAANVAIMGVVSARVV